jgi:hypothetical protein
MGMYTMINKNMEKIQGLKNLFDYEEYVQSCKKNEVEINDLQRFCTGIGVLMVGRNKYPKKDWQGAYTQTFQDISDQDPVECCGGEKKIPSLPKRAVSYAKAQIEHTKSGRKLTSGPEYLKRLSVCIKCDSLKEHWFCAECGCPMKTKAEWKEQKCKLDKW